MAKLLREFYKIVEVLVGDSKLGAKAPRWVNINSRSIGLPAQEQMAWPQHIDMGDDEIHLIYHYLQDGQRVQTTLVVTDVITEELADGTS